MAKVAKKEDEKTLEKLTNDHNFAMKNSVFSNKAFSIIYTGNKKYSVVVVDFDIETGKTGDVKTIESNLDLYECHDVFKKEVVKAGLFDQGHDA